MRVVLEASADRLGLADVFLLKVRGGLEGDIAVFLSG